jgi:hypothetical protein
MAVTESMRVRAGRSAPPEWFWRVAPLAAAAVAAAVYLMLAPKTGDLPAHVYRAKLFGRDGFAVWNGNWYGGHHTPGYSLLFPPIAWVLGPAVAGALAALAATAVFEPLARHHFGRRARWGALWFGIGTSSMLLNAQLPFVLGVAIGLGSLLALQRGRTVPAVLLAVLCPLGSPVAGFFLALAAIAYWLSSRSRGPLVVAVAAMAPPILLALAFPEGGRQPYAFSAFIPVPIMVIVFCFLLLRDERTLRIGAVLYGLAAFAAFVAATPMGGNASRLGAVFAGPIAASIVFGGLRPALRPWLIAVILVPLAYWQLVPALRNVSSEQNDSSRFSAYYHPLLVFLEEHERPPGRVEVVFTHSNWEAATVAIHAPLARGWERQLDVSRNALFYNGTLDEGTYENWLDENAVRWVALPDVPLDYSAKKEAQIVEAGPPYLALRFRSLHWRIYEVTSPHPLVVPEGSAQIQARTLGITRVRLLVNQPGSAIVRVRWTPYWLANGACVERAGDWTRVVARKPGPLLLRVRFAFGRMFEHGRRCAP